MTLLLSFDTASSPEVPNSHNESVVYEFVKRNTIPEVETELGSRVNIFGASDKLNMFHNDQLKNNNPLSVPLPISYAVKLHCKD